jgi:aspartyl-tRNA(Asn)/glutamyl-tRNA(Gln) amidotransferase subunit B
VDRTKYDIIIGLEIHVQSKTESKMFCSCKSQYFEKEPNTQVCPTCLGLPGALPVPNKRAIELCILLGLATNCDIDSEIHFDRKHYFYPDLPKGYQISQYKRPICSDGSVDIKDEDGKKYTVEIERIHQEEDVAKSTHHTESSSGLEYSLIDYNKSGVPLIEIVSRPNIRSAYQAREYAERIRQIVRYLGISDADMEKGQMRCEPNISVQEKGKWEYKNNEILPIGDYRLNPKVEVKNIGSISAVEKSIEYEVERIVGDIEQGKKVIQQTRGWNADKGKTEFQRSKETADDYRYMPDPDIPIIDISTDNIDRISKELVELPSEKIERYKREYELSDYDCNVLTADRDISKYFEDVLTLLSDGKDIKKAAKSSSNWITGAVFSIANDRKIDINEENIPKDDLVHLIRVFEQNKLTRSKAEELLRESLENEKDLEILIEKAIEESLKSASNLGDIVDTVISNNPKAVQDYKSGKQTTIGFLIGQVMKETKGTADPNEAKSVLMEKLNG